MRYLYNTGSRISEVAEARTSWLSLTAMPEAAIRGKGGKCRVCPLWTTTAVHLLRAGIEINVIKAWLGHADVSTTSQYLDLDLGKNREALADTLEALGHGRNRQELRAAYLRTS